MKNKTTTYKWAYLPFVFSSAAILATQVTAAPTGQQYQDAKQVNSISHEYVGSGNAIGFGIDDEGNLDATLDGTLSSSANHRTGAGLWAGYDIDDKEIQGRGGQINHAWVSRDASGRATHVNKAFAAYDRNAAGNDRATIGYGQENENLFWDGRLSKSLSGGTGKRTVRDANGNNVTVTDRGYDWGVGASVGKFLPDANARVRAGIDHEWSDKVGSGEKDARNTTLSAGIEKFFHGTGHSVSLDVAGSKRSGGFGNDDDTDFNGRLGYKYDFGGASIYQPDRRYRRVRVEVPGQAVAPRYAQKQQYKKVPTYKTVPTYKNVPVYGNKQVRVPTKQLVKSTMELEGQTFFKLNSSKLIPSAQTRLKQIAAQIRKTGYKGSIRITGNTCGLGNARYDQILSEKRANEVRNFLIKNGFNPNHLIARGLGKGHPKYPRTPDQDFKNRRVDIEYVTEQKAVKTGYRTENKRVQTGTRKVQAGTRRVATGFKNVPAGMKNVMISNGRPGAPRVIWKTEAIPTSPAWITRALNNNIRHNTNINTYTTTFGNEGPIDNIVRASNDKAETEQGQSVTINVLANDDADATITSIVNAPSNGTAIISGGQIVYTPNPGFTGTDTLTYEVRDPSGNTTTANVDIIVKATNNVPVATNDASNALCGSPVTIDVLGNDTDADGDSLTITSFTQPDNGTVTRGANGTLIYTPNTGAACGIDDSFDYTISDGNGGTSTATATVTIDQTDNIAPAAQDDSATTSQGTAVALNVLGNDTSNSGSGQLTITSVDAPQNGTAQIVNGQIVYTPNGSFVGTDRFTYTITDSNGETATATATVVVNGPDNVAPVAQNDSATTQQGDAVTLNVLGNDTSNSGSNQLTIINVGNPQNGTTTIVGDQIVYTPNADFVGTESFTYTVRDSNGLTTSATATVTVEGDKPEAQDDSASTTAGDSVSIDVLDNDDTNSGSGNLTIIDAGNPSQGTVAIVGGEIVYTANAGASGTDTFTYTIKDSNGLTTTATVTVTISDKAPEAQNDSANTTAGDSVSIDVTENDTSNSTSGNLTIIDAGNPSKGTVAIVNGEIVYTANAGASGTDTFTYTIEDSNGLTTTANVTVNIEGNKAPEAKNDSVSTGCAPITIDVLSNDSDPENDSLSIVSVDGNSLQYGTAMQSGNQIIYQPLNTCGKGNTGVDNFSYTITDGNGNTDSANVKVTVKGVTGGGNTQANADDVMISSGETITINVLANDNGNGLRIINVDNPANGHASVRNNKIVYTPNAGFTGMDMFYYDIVDENGYNSASSIIVDVIKGSTKSN